MKANILKEAIHAAYYFKFPVSSISPANRKSHFENSQPQRLPFEIIIRKIRPRAVVQLDPYALAQSTQDSWEEYQRISEKLTLLDYGISSEWRLILECATFLQCQILTILTVVIVTFQYPQKLSMYRTNHTSDESIELMNCWQLDWKNLTLDVVVRHLRDLSHKTG